MPPRSAAELFEAYAEAHARGERPRARDYLDRADAGERERLAELIDGYLASTPVRAATSDDVALVEAWTAVEPPLLALRKLRRLRRAEVVDALLKALALDVAKREKLSERYHELETGQLDAARVDRRVWEALAQVLRLGAKEVAAAMRPRSPLVAERTYFARARVVADERVAALADRQEPVPPDDVDVLFGVGRSDR